MGRAVFVTSFSGAGKTSVATELARRRFPSCDTGDDSTLSRSIDDVDATTPLERVVDEILAIVATDR